MRAARAARVFFFTRPIKFLICDVVIPVAVVDSFRDLKIQDGSKDDGRQEVDFPYNACALETLFVYMDCVTPLCFVDYGKNTILALWFLCALFHCFSL